MNHRLPAQGTRRRHEQPQLWLLSISHPSPASNAVAFPRSPRPNPSATLDKKMTKLGKGVGWQQNTTTKPQLPPRWNGRALTHTAPLHRAEPGSNPAVPGGPTPVPTPWHCHQTSTPRHSRIQAGMGRWQPAQPVWLS